MTLRARLTFGMLDLVTACLVGVGVFRALPARWWPVDTLAALLVALMAAASAGLLLGKGWGPRVARAASLVALVVGLALIATLALTASYLSAIYGPVGKGGSLILVLVAALALPYLVALPAAELVWVGGAKR